MLERKVEQSDMLINTLCGRGLKGKSDKNNKVNITRLSSITNVWDLLRTFCKEYDYRPKNTSLTATEEVLPRLDRSQGGASFRQRRLQRRAAQQSLAKLQEISVTALNLTSDIIWNLQ